MLCELPVKRPLLPSLSRNAFCCTDLRLLERKLAQQPHNGLIGAAINRTAVRNALGSRDDRWLREAHGTTRAVLGEKYTHASIIHATRTATAAPPSVTLLRKRSKRLDINWCR